MRPLSRLLALRPLATTAAAAVALSVVGAAPATAVPAGPVRHLVLELAATDPAAVTQLAHVTGLATGARRARLAALAPTAETEARVLSTLAALGVARDGADTGWTVPVSGPAAVLDSLFPVAGVGIRAVPGWLPAVTRVVDADDATPLYRRSSAAASAPTATPTPDGCGGRAAANGFGGYVGLDLTTQYSGVAPSCSLWDGSTTSPIIATIQYSGWVPGDADTEARGQTGTSSASPSTSGQITSVPVGNRTSTAPTAADGDGQDEVALDVEAILRTAPTLRQRVYIASNTTAGENAAYARILSDIQAGLNITVVSTSWGGCEQIRKNGSTYPANVFPETAIGNLVAAGVTMFAASGDAGAYDCGDGTTLSVDYPASSPKVVGVGGTTWPRPSAANRTEYVWADSANGVGSGGGYSDYFARPAYQNVVSTNSRRGVPDLSVVGDASTGVRTYTSDSGGFFLGGGTSVSAPALAGMFESEVLSLGQTTGLGDVHTALYSGATATSAGASYTDVTAGSNLHYPAATGYDVASGLGTPRLSTLGSTLVTPPAPVAGAVTATTGSNQTVRAGTAYPTNLVATVTTASGSTTPVPGASVTFSVPAGRAMFAGGATSATVTTGSDGKATAPVLTAGTTVGSFQVTATTTSTATFTATFAESVTAGAAAAVAATTGASQTAQPNQAFGTPLRATVTDSAGNPVSGVAVVFGVPASGPSGTFGAGTAATSTTVTTDASGVATAPTLTANGTTGSFGATATVSGLTAVSFANLTVSSVTGVTSVAGSGQSTRAATTFGSPLQAQLAGSGSLANIAVTFTLPSGIAVFSSTGSATQTVMTDARGLATSGAVTATARGTGTAVAAVGSSTTTGFALTVLAESARRAGTPLAVAGSRKPGPAPRVRSGRAAGPAVGRRSGALVG